MKQQFVRISVALFVAALAVQPIGNEAWADEERWVVAAVKGGAWRSSEQDPSVRTALQPGDAVRPGEMLETFQNNQVALANDPSGQNIMAVRGAFQLRQKPGVTRVDLQRGRTLAVLDGLRGKGDFSVRTPTGTAAVRGTRFSVEAPAARMDVKTYRGEVLVTSSPPPGRRQRAVERVTLIKGKKVGLDSGQPGKAETSDLTERDWKEYEESLEFIRAARRGLKENGVRWFEEADRPDQARRVPSDAGSGAIDDDDARSIVF